MKRITSVMVLLVLLGAIGIGIGANVNNMAPNTNTNTNTNADYQAGYQAGKLAAYQEMSSWAAQMMAQLQGQGGPQTLQAPPIDINTYYDLKPNTKQFEPRPQEMINDTMNMPPL